MAKPKVVDLFSGCGGLSLGFSMAGFSISVASDWDKNVEKTFKHNKPRTKFIQKDVAELTSDEILSYEKDIDVVIGGPPCQGFSIANTKTRDMTNPASQASWHFIRLVGELQPTVFVMENVLGFLNMEKGNVYRKFYEGFKKLGYHVQLFIARADEFGVPQKRERVFFIGTKNGEFLVFFPREKPATVRDAISDLPALSNGGGGEDISEYDSPPESKYQELMRNNSKCLFNHRSTINKPKLVERFRHIPEGGNWKNIPERLMDDYKDLSKVHSHIYKRLEWDNTSVTIANFRKAVILHPQQHRILSVREAARIQSFPDKSRFFGNLGAQQQQVADAVPPLLAKTVGKFAKKLL